MEKFIANHVIRKKFILNIFLSCNIPLVKFTNSSAHKTTILLLNERLVVSQALYFLFISQILIFTTKSVQFFHDRNFWFLLRRYALRRDNVEDWCFVMRENSTKESAMLVAIVWYLCIRQIKYIKYMTRNTDDLINGTLLRMEKSLTFRDRFENNSII